LSRKMTGPGAGTGDRMRSVVLPLDDLETYERLAQEALAPGNISNLGTQAWARKVLKLAEEVRRCWKLIEERAPTNATPKWRGEPRRPLDATGPATAGGKHKVSIE
jgi:hypothetical protein